MSKNDHAPVLLLDAVGLRLSAEFALTGVSLSVGPREAVAVVGSNGSGKSTLFNVISGICAPSTGQLFLLGLRADGRSPSSMAQRGLGRLFQESYLVEEMTVEENVALGLYRGLSRGWVAGKMRTEEALQEVGLLEHRSNFPKELSFFQRRKIELARLLCGESQLCLVDEPTSGLSESESREFTSGLSLLKAKGASLLIAEHNLEVVRNLCEKVIMLSRGAVVFSGGIADFLQRGAAIWETGRQEISS